MLNVHLNEFETEALFLYFDGDQSGEISSKEFLEAIRQHNPVHVLGDGQKFTRQGEQLSEVSMSIFFVRSEEDVSAEKLSQAMNFLRKSFKLQKLLNCMASFDNTIPTTTAI